jgi:hypothetical protein
MQKTQRNAQHFVERVWVRPTLKEDGEAGSPVKLRLGKLNYL